MPKPNTNIKNSNQQQNKMEYLAYGKGYIQAFARSSLDKSNHYTPFILGYFTNYKTRMENGAL